MSEDINFLKPGEKYILTISEAVVYFGISSKQLRRIAHNPERQELFFRNGKKLLIKRSAFERFLDGISEL